MGIGPRMGGPKVHNLKCDAGYYEAVALGHKTAELRLNDRDFSPLDILRLHEMEFGKPTGRSIEKQITHIVWDSNGPWLAPGYCMLSLGAMPACEHVPMKAALDNSVHCIRCGVFLGEAA